MAFVLSARWPNGTYLAHRADGSAELFPTFARVYSALVHAAGTGTQAADSARDAADGFARITAESVETLTWLERTPPVAIALPAWPHYVPGSSGDGSFGYRLEGVIQIENKVIKDKIKAHVLTEPSWFSQPIRWFWAEQPPEDVVQHLDALCADVGTLGEADSPAILEVGTAANIEDRTHDLVEVGLFEDRGDEYAVPAPGRLVALEEQFRTANPSRRPTVAADKPVYGQGGLPHSEAPTASGLAHLRLISRERAQAAVPWETAVLLPVLDGPVVADEDRVSVAVALHRALIAAIGQECPPVVTGRYRSDDPPPVNRVALHYLPPGCTPREARPERAHFAVLIPRGIAITDEDQVHRGIARLRPLHVRGVGTFRLDAPSMLPGESFWPDPKEGTEREWATSPVAIPERHTKGIDTDDTLCNALAWSLGNVLRGLHRELASPEVPQRREWLEEQGVEVTEIESHWTAAPRRFVHRTPGRIPIMPYRARLTLGAVVADTAVVAVGQSRHLGGGLLVPVDRRVRSGAVR